MIRRLPGAIACGALGAVGGASWLVIVYAIAPAIVHELDRALPPIVRGIYGPERDEAGLSFAWTGPRATIQLQGLDRRIAWTFTARARGARADVSTLPDVTIAVDGITRGRWRTSNEFEDLAVTLPSNDARRGAVITISSDPTSNPGPHDNRDLGVVLDRLSLRPAEGVALPPREAILAAGLAAGMFALALGLMGFEPLLALSAAFAVGGLQALFIASGFGPFGRWLPDLPWLAFWTGGALIAALAVVERLHASGIRQTARFVLAFSAAAGYLKLLALLHPDMAIGDTMFQAHRFEWVLAGRYYFTSVAPGLYEFPYAIALYVAALPFAPLTQGVVGHMALLRIVTVAADAAAGALLYVIVSRGWGDRLAGAIAVALYHLIPIGFGVESTGNLTNAFAQSLAVAALASVASGSLRLQNRARVLLTALLAAAAFLGHTSTFAILLPTGLLAALLFACRGGPVLRSPAAAVAVAFSAGLVLAVALYYGHFGEVYREQFRRIAADLAGPAPADPAGRSPLDRVRLVPGYLSAYLGLPSLALAAAGAVRLRDIRPHDRLTLTITAWLVVCAGFLLVGILTPVDMRHYLAAYPAVAMLAGLGAACHWRHADWRRGAVVAMLAWAAWSGVRGWVVAID
jgi:hypothetical protein